MSIAVSEWDSGHLHWNTVYSVSKCQNFIVNLEICHTTPLSKTTCKISFTTAKIPVSPHYSPKTFHKSSCAVTKICWVSTCILQVVIRGLFGSGERDKQSANRVRLPLSYHVFLSSLSIPAFQIIAEVLEQGSKLLQVHTQLLTTVWILVLRVQWALELFLIFQQCLA